MLCRRLLSPAGLLAGIILFWLASVPLSCLGGPVSLTLPEIWSVFAGMAGFGESAVDPVARSVISEIRLSRAVLALLCGGTLAVAGVALQGVLRNPLADPFTLGISSGAACGAAAASCGKSRIPSRRMSNAWREMRSMGTPYEGLRTSPAPPKTSGEQHGPVPLPDGSRSCILRFRTVMSEGPPDKSRSPCVMTGTKDEATGSVLPCRHA